MFFFPCFSNETIHRAKTYARIRINLIFIAIGVVGSGTAVFLGKKAAREGISLEDQNILWHKKVNEEYHTQQAAKKLADKEFKEG